MTGVSAIDSTTVPKLRLYEALLWEPGSGFFLLTEHLERLARSARSLAFEVDLDRVAADLLDHSRTLAKATKVRLEVGRRGDTCIENQRLKPAHELALSLASIPVRHDDVFLRHKTSNRAVYEAARAAAPGADDVILFNERGELTETTAGNLVLELGGRQLTPALEAGLLPGTFRRHLIECGTIMPARLTTADLARATRLWMINSVRRRCDARVCNEGRSL